MDLSPQATQCAMAKNLQKMLPYWRRTISKMEACLEKIEALPPYENREKSPVELKILEQEQAEIFKNIRAAFSNFEFAYWAYTDPHALASEVGTSLTETIMSDEYKNNFCTFDVSVETKNDWLLVKTPPLPSRYKRWAPFKNHNAVDNFPLYERELDAALSRKFAAFSEEELRKFWGYHAKISPTFLPCRKTIRTSLTPTIGTQKQRRISSAAICSLTTEHTARASKVSLFPMKSCRWEPTLSCLQTSKIRPRYQL